MDRLTEMEVFANVVDEGGFTDAARKMGISKSAVSKHVATLETRLGARLLNRTTRRVSPTEIGLVYYDRARQVLNDAGEADALVSAMQSAPTGLLRVSAAADFATAHLSPVLGDFLRCHPGLRVAMDLTTAAWVDPVAAGSDVVLRVGEMADSSLRARKLAETTVRMVASPAYLAAAGRPQRIDDLNGHRLLHHAQGAAPDAWRLIAPSGEVRQVRSAGWLMVNDGRSLLNAAVAGLGIAHLPDYLYAEAARAGGVEEVMPALPVEAQGLYAVYPEGRYMQPKVRAFIDFLVAAFAHRGIGRW